MLSLFVSQTPSPKPTKTPARLNSLRTTSIYGFSVCHTDPTPRSLIVTVGHVGAKTEPAKRKYLNHMLTCCHIERNGRKTLTTVQGLPKKFDQKKILKVIKKKFGMLSYPPSTLIAAAMSVHPKQKLTIVQLAMAPSSLTLRWER